MTKVKIVPVEPTNKMINKAINVPIPLVLLDSICAAKSLEFTTKYKTALDEVPDPTENAKLVERVAKHLARCEFRRQKKPDPTSEEYFVNKYWDEFRTEAKDLLKVIQEGNE